jgi:hypothetical protein
VAEKPEIYTIPDLIARVENGERIFIHVTQFAAFIVEAELARVPFAIKTAVVKDQIILERWAVGGDNWDDGVGGREDKPWLH